MSENELYTVIVVDDSADVRRLVKRALAAESIECDLAADGVEARERILARQYDAIISDLRMPRMHGHKLMLEAFEQGGPPVPFIVITGVTDPRVIKDLYLRGATDVITKPFNYTLLAVRVRHILDQWKKASAMEGKGDSRESVARQLETTTALIRQQLSDVTTSFEQTIAQLTRQQDELENGYVDSVRVLANLMDQVGQSNRSHAVRVENACVAIAAGTKYPKEDLLHLKIAALLHEIGAFGMPDSVRLKAPGALTPEERAYYNRYPEIGATFLAELRHGRQVVEFVQCHAENFDGSGIPGNKTGREVPLGARILRIADGCDTFLMHHASEDKFGALQELLISDRGRCYDPVLIPLALNYFDKYLGSVEPSFVLPAADLHDGLVLAENILDDAGHFLARQGVELTANLAERLRAILHQKEVRVRRKSNDQQ